MSNDFKIVWHSGPQSLSVPEAAIAADYPKELILELAQIISALKIEGRFHLEVHERDGYDSSGHRGIRTGAIIRDEHLLRIIFYDSDGTRPSYDLEPPDLPKTLAVFKHDIDRLVSFRKDDGSIDLGIPDPESFSGFS